MNRGCSHGGIYSVLDPKRVKLDFSSNVNPLGAPKQALKVIQSQAAKLVPVYPDSNCSALKKSLVQYLGINDSSMISVGNGAVEIIYGFSQAFAKKRVVIPSPTFCEYEIASRRAGAQVSFVPLSKGHLHHHPKDNDAKDYNRYDDNFKLDPDAIIKSARGADAIFLCNPNNPTGLLATEEIRKIIQASDPSTKILLDECFIEFVDKPRSNTLLEMVSTHKNLVVLRSLTKSFGMAGLRLGYSVSNSALSEAMQAVMPPWNVNGLAQAAGVKALADRHYVSRTRQMIARERKFLYDRIRRRTKLEPMRSDVNYFLIKLISDSTEFRDRLLRKNGVLVRDCSTFTGMGNRYIRVAIRTHTENVALVCALEGEAAKTANGQK